MGSERDHLDPRPSSVAGASTPRSAGSACTPAWTASSTRPRGCSRVGGAQVLLNSLNSFALDEASLHVPVRAVENRVWVVAANKVGPLVPERSIAMVAERVGVPVEMLHGAGESQIVAPDGTVVAIGPRTGEAVVVADIEVALADDKRRPDGTDVMTSRRPDLYGPILDAPARAAARRPAPTSCVHRGRQPGRRRRRSRPCWPRRSRTGAGPGRAARAAPGVATDAIVARARRHAAPSSRPASPRAAAHVGLVLVADGVVLRQPQLHASARHAVGHRARRRARWSLDLPWGRLALIVGDDALYPETFRLAALQDVDVVAVPFTTQAARRPRPAAPRAGRREPAQRRRRQPRRPGTARARSSRCRPTSPCGPRGRGRSRA